MSKSPFEKFEVPRELIEAAYESLKMSLEVRGVKKGTNETTKAIERGTAKIVLIAENVDPPEIVAHLPILCREKKIPYMYVPSKSDLGEACGLGVSSAAASVVDPGEGQKLLDDIIAHLKKLGAHKG